MRAVFLAATLLYGPLGIAACAVDPATLPKTYLLQAQQAVAAHDAPAALAALARAETLWTNVNYRAPFFSYEPQALRDMGNARSAVQLGRWSDAEYYVRTALTHPSVVRPSFSY